MEREKTLERKTWIDILKGILILFVIWGHTTTNSLVLNWLSSFYMPCFFILSGWLIKKEGKLKKFVYKKVRGVLFPYFCFALLWVLFCFLKNFIVESDFNLFRALLSIVLPYSGRVGGSAYNLWFLPCLFLSQILIAVVVYGKGLGKVIAILAWTIFLMLGIFVKNYCSLLYATALASVFVGFGFYISNYFVPKLKSRKVGLQIMTAVIGGFTHISCLILNVVILKNTLDFSAASFGIVPIYMLGGLGGSVFFIGIVSILKDIPPLEYVGKNSLVYYALHYEILAIVGFVVFKFIGDSLLMEIIIFVLTLVLTTVVVWIYNKLKIEKLFT